MIAHYLEQAIKAAGHPIVGVSIGRASDKSTWRVDPPELQTAAQPVIDAFTAPTAQQLLDDIATREIDAKVLKAIVIELHAIIPAPKPTLVQLRNSIIARYKSL